MDTTEHVKKHQKVIDFANVFKAFVGTNYLSLSYGFSQAGLGFAFIMLVIVSGLTNHCCKLIVRCKHLLVEDLCEKYQSRLENVGDTAEEHHHLEIMHFRKRLQKNMDYADIGKLTFGRGGSVIVNVFLVVTQIGFCVGYMVFVGNMLHNFFPVEKGNGTLVNGTIEEIDWLNDVVNKEITTSQIMAKRMAGNNLSITEDSVNSPDQNSSTIVNAEDSFLFHKLLKTFNAGIYENDTGESSGISLLILIVLPLPLFVLFTMFRNVRQLGVISVLANTSIIIGFASVLGYIVIDFKISDDFRWFVFSTLPVYIAQVIGAYEAIGTIIPIEASMENNRHKFSQTMNIVVVGFTVLIACLSSLGYLHYGSQTKQIIDFVILVSLLVAENLPPHSPVVILINVTLIIGVICTYPLQIFPVVEILENMIFAEGKCCGPPVKTLVNAVENKPLLNEDDDTEMPTATLGLHVATYVPDSVPAWKRNILRLGVAVFVTGLALLLRNVFAYVGAIVGSIGSCPLAFILPCLFHIKINKMCMSKLEILQDVTIVVFGIVCGVVGFVVSLMEIITRI